MSCLVNSLVRMATHLPLKKRGLGACCILIASLAGAGCELRQRMWDQPKVEPLERSAFFADGRSARPLVEGTVARGMLREDELLHTGMDKGALSMRFPFPVTEEVMNRGRERFNIYCTPCHDRAGTGNGMIVQRGLKKPTSFHDMRLRVMPPGYFFFVMTKGFVEMKSYSYQVKPEDRWAIAAYIKALQLSQNATIQDVPDAERERILAEK